MSFSRNKNASVPSALSAAAFFVAKKNKHMFCSALKAVKKPFLNNSKQVLQIKCCAPMIQGDRPSKGIPNVTAVVKLPSADYCTQKVDYKLHASLNSKGAKE